MLEAENILPREASSVVVVGMTAHRKWSRRPLSQSGGSSDNYVVADNLLEVLPSERMAARMVLEEDDHNVPSDSMEDRSEGNYMYSPRRYSGDSGCRSSFPYTHDEIVDDVHPVWDDQCSKSLPLTRHSPENLDRVLADRLAPGLAVESLDDVVNETVVWQIYVSVEV